jgi:NADH-ubiquinone oxidoreductase chain 3
MTTTTFFIIFIPVLAVLLLSINLLLAPHNPYQEKDSVFECGFHSFLGQNRTQFSVSFFIFALLFLLFDLEILLVYPYSVSGYNNDIYGLVIMMIFFILLTLGFIFELGKNALTIDSKQTFSYNNNEKSKCDVFVYCSLLVLDYILSYCRACVFLLDLLLSYYMRILRDKYNNLNIKTPSISMWLERWFLSSNAKDIGILYLIYAIFSELVGTAFSVLIKLELSGQGVQSIADNQLYNSIITAHAIIMIFFIVMTALIVTIYLGVTTFNLSSPGIYFKVKKYICVLNNFIEHIISIFILFIVLLVVLFFVLLEILFNVSFILTVHEIVVIKGKYFFAKKSLSCIDLLNEL